MNVRLAATTRARDVRVPRLPCAASPNEVGAVAGYLDEGTDDRLDPE
jgi:hypothetical protein